MKAIKLAIVIFCGMFFINCAMTPEQRACYQVLADQSLLCSVLGEYWEEGTAVMRITNAVMIQEGVYSAHVALEVVNQLEQSLDVPGGAIYGIFFKLVAEKAGPLVAITVNEAIGELYNMPQLITPFDKSLIKAELAKHRLNIELFLSMEKK